MKAVLSILILLLTSQCLLAQHVIDSFSNASRHGDVLNKIEVNFVNPGCRGANQIWQLGQCDKQSRHVRQEIVSLCDTIAVIEADHIYHFVMRNDTLFNKGEQSRHAYMLYNELRPMLRYPFQYGDSISDYYSGIGKDGNAGIHRSGWGYSVADGTGILTAGLDIYKDALRVHHHDEFTDLYYSADTICLHTTDDRYVWFIRGYRYPIQESEYRTVTTDGSILSTDSLTILYLPGAQSELADDPANYSILSDKTNTSGAPQKDNPIKQLQATISTDGRNLNLNFTLTDVCDFSFIVCDVMGNVLGYMHRSKYVPGDWQENILLSRRPVGNTLTINVQCNGQTTSLKVGL